MRGQARPTNLHLRQQQRPEGQKLLPTVTLCSGPAEGMDASQSVTCTTISQEYYKNITTYLVQLLRGSLGRLSGGKLDEGKIFAVDDPD